MLKQSKRTCHNSGTNDWGEKKKIHSSVRFEPQTDKYTFAYTDWCG